MLTRALKAILASVNLKVVRLSLLPRGVVLEVDLKRLFRKKLPAVIFDVGANIGQTSERFLHFNPSADIQAFEPILATYQYLVSRMGKNPRIHCHHLALGEKNEEVEMLCARSTGNRRIDPADSIENESREKVKMLQLDAFCEQHSIAHIDLLKTDCEGYDLEVLLGARNLLAKGRIDVIYCEVNFVRDGFLADFFKIERYLSEHGYLFYALYECFGDYVGCHTNALFVRREFWAASYAKC